jgi:hypothetical protein
VAIETVEDFDDIVVLRLLSRGVVRVGHETRLIVIGGLGEEVLELNLVGLGKPNPGRAMNLGDHIRREDRKVSSDHLLELRRSLRVNAQYGRELQLAYHLVQGISLVYHPLDFRKGHLCTVHSVSKFRATDPTESTLAVATATAGCAILSREPFIVKVAPQ